MHNLAASWLMLSLTHSPLRIALVQATTTLPVLVLLLPAGIIASKCNLRNFICFTQGWLFLVAMILSFLSFLHLLTPTILLLLTFAVGVGNAINLPAWQTALFRVVPLSETPKAAALNSISIGIARIIGPLLGVLIINKWGVTTVFCLNALSFIGVIYAFYAYFPTKWAMSLQHVSNHTNVLFSTLKNKVFYRLLTRIFCIFFCISVLWAFMPMIARIILHGSLNDYSFLIISFGFGAITGNVLTTKLIARTGTSQSMIIYTSFLLVLAMFFILKSEYIFLSCIIYFIVGICWISTTTMQTVTVAQLFPKNEHANAFAMYLWIFNGSLALGSAFWGKVASHINFQTSMHYSAVSLIVVIIAMIIKTGGNHRVAQSEQCPDN
jgi:predicted MFS family arabinose efflux permease